MIFIDIIIAIICCVVSLFLQFIPIEPLYFYNEMGSMNAPKRTEWISIQGFYALIFIFPVIVLSIMYISLVKIPSLSRFLQMISLLIFSVSFSSIICSIIHMFIGTPRIDSVEQCRNKDISFKVCREVLTKFETVQQFNSFPAVEPAMAMTVAIIFIFFIEMPHGFSFVEMILKFALITWGLLIASIYTENSSYRIQDVIAGVFIGFIVGVVTIFTFKKNIEQEENAKINDRDYTDASSDASFRISRPKLF